LIPLRPDIFVGRVEGDDFCSVGKQARSPKPDVMQGISVTGHFRRSGRGRWFLFSGETGAQPETRHHAKELSIRDFLRGLRGL